MSASRSQPDSSRHSRLIFAIQLHEGLSLVQAVFMARKATRELARLRALLKRIWEVNPTRDVCSVQQKRERYAEKARLQTLLIETYPHEVRVQAHADMPGVVSLSVPKLNASAAHAVLDELPFRTRVWIEEQLAADEDATVLPEVRWTRGSEGSLGDDDGLLAKATRFLAEYDFECAQTTLEAVLHDSQASHDMQRTALLMLLDLYVDQLANDRAALALAPLAESFGPISEQAFEWLGVAAHRLGEVDKALAYFSQGRSERVAALLVEIGDDAVHLQAWERARRAWTELQTLVARQEHPSDSPVATLRDGLKARMEAVAWKVSVQALETNPELALFVKHFAPEHPWFEQCRIHKQRVRARKARARLFESARDGVDRNDRKRVEEVLHALSRWRGEEDSRDRERVAELQAWVTARRIEELSAQAMTLAGADELEDACWAFMELPREPQMTLVESGHPLFATLAALLRAVDEGPSKRSLARAAVAWIRGGALEDPLERLDELAPYRGLLQSIPEFEAELLRLDDARPLLSPVLKRLSEPGDPTRAGRSEVIHAGLRIQAASPPGTVETLAVASQTYCLGSTRFILTLDRCTSTGSYGVGLYQPGRHAMVRYLCLEGPSGWHPRDIFAMGEHIVLVDEALAGWCIALFPTLALRRVEFENLLMPIPSVESTLLPLDEHTLGLKIADQQWTLLDIRTGLCQQGPDGCGVHWAHNGEGFQYCRTGAGVVEWLDQEGKVEECFEFPREVVPEAVLGSPLGRSPMVLARFQGARDVNLWWQPQPGLFRSFSLFDTRIHGAFVEGLTFPGRALMVRSRRSDGTTFVHTVTADRGWIRPRQSAKRVTEPTRLVFDSSGRKGWAVRRSKRGHVQIDPLNLHPDTFEPG